MDRFNELMSKVWKVFYGSLHRFPETVFISAAFVVIAIVNNRLPSDPQESLERILFILGLALPLSATLRLLSEKLGNHQWHLYAFDMGLPLYALVFWFFMPEALDDKFGIRYAFSLGIALFLFTLVPYLFKRRHYVLYCIRLLVSFVVTYFYTLVLYLGVIAIIFAVDFLFELSISDKIYFDTFVASFGLFGLTYFLGKLPTIAETNENLPYPSVLRILFTAIVAPLIAIYTLVLHAYFLRILIVTGWQDSYISPLVLWYGFVSVALLILMDPLKEDNRIAGMFTRFYPYGMIVPLMMLVISMGIRINAYGITVDRALVFVAWTWFLFSVVYLLTTGNRWPQYVVLGFVLVFGLTVYGPVNVFGVSEISQINRLSGKLAEVNMLENDQVIARTDLDESSQILISDLLTYLDTYRSLGKVPYLPVGFTLDDMYQVFGFDHILYVSPVSDKNTYVNYYVDAPLITDITLYDYHIGLNSSHDNNMPVLPNQGIHAYGSKDMLMLSKDGTVFYEVVPSELLMSVKLPVTYKEGDEPVHIEVSESDFSLYMVFSEIRGTYEEGALDLDSYRMAIYVTFD